MSSDIQVGDVVVCVSGKLSLCPVHNETNLGPDPNPEMVGNHYRVQRLVRPWQHRCVGFIIVQGSDAHWCAGCFRRLNDEPDNAELIARIRSSRPIVETVK